MCSRDIIVSISLMFNGKGLIESRAFSYCQKWHTFAVYGVQDTHALIRKMHFQDIFHLAVSKCSRGDTQFSAHIFIMKTGY